MEMFIHDVVDKGDPVQLIAATEQSNEGKHQMMLYIVCFGTTEYFQT